MNRRKSSVTAAYYAAFIAMGISMSSLGPTLPGLAANTRSSISAISVLFTARALGSLVGSVWGGRIYDHLNGNDVMGLTVIGIAVLSAFTPFIHQLWLLTALLFFTGAVQGILNIGGNALLVWLHGRDVGPFMNGLHFCYGIGTFVAPVIVAQFVAQQNGLIWTYLLLAVIILPTAVVAFLPSPSSPLLTAPQAAGKLDPLLITLIALVFGCYSGASLAYGGWIYTYALDMKMAGAVNAAYLTSIFWGALTLGRLAAIPISRRFKPLPILMVDFFAALVSLLALQFWPSSLVAAIITSAGLGLALASIYPTTMLLSGELMTLSGRVTGLFSIGNSAGSMIIPWIVGQFFERSGPQSMQGVLLADMLVALVILALLSRRSAAQTATAKE